MRNPSSQWLHLSLDRYLGKGMDLGKSARDFDNLKEMAGFLKKAVKQIAVEK